MYEKEFSTVIGLTPEKRYEYFIKKVVDYEEIWTLFENGWVLSTDGQGNSLFPIWPKKEFAQFCAKEEWKKCEVKSIDLDEFMNEWADSFRNEGIHLDVFSNNESSVSRKIDDLLIDLTKELENY